MKFLRGKFHQEMLMDSPSGGHQAKEGWKNEPFSSFKVNISKLVGDTAKVTINH